MGKDITKKILKKQNHHLSSNTIYQDFFNLPFVGNGIINLNNNWIEYNDSLCNILSVSKNNLKDISWLDFIHPDYLLEDKNIFNRIIKNEINYIIFETKIIRADGILIVAQISLSRLNISVNDEVFLGFQLVDITSRKQLEESLKKNEMLAQRNLEELEWIYSNAPIGLCHLDINLRFKRINKFLASINGLPPNAHIGKSIQQLFPSLADTITEVTQTILANKRPIHQEFRRDNKLHPEKTRFFDENWYPLFDENKVIIGFGAVVEEITEKKHVSALKAADRRKNELLATLAHELRNPIGSVGAALELMRMIDENDHLGAHRDRTPLDRAERQIKHMKQLVEDILTVTRIKQGKIELRKEKLDIITTINQAIETIQSKLFEKELHLKTHIPNTPIFVNFDPMRMTQAIINLLDNAIKFSTNESKIELSIRLELQDILIVIRDQGIGIPAKGLANIFDIFNQIQVTADKKNEGVGIGLALVKNIVELHGGTVEAKSDGIGRGSTFIVRIPQNSEINPSIQ